MGLSYKLSVVKVRLTPLGGPEKFIWQEWAQAPILADLRFIAMTHGAPNNGCPVTIPSVFRRF